MEIQLDKLRRVEFTMRAFRWYKTKTGHSILTNGISEEMLTDEEVMINLTLAGLIGAKHEESNEALEEIVVEKVNLQQFLKVVKAISEGVNALSEKDEGK